MDGLECNVLRYRELFPNNSIFRIDSEFFGKDPISIEKKLNALSCFYLKENEIVSGPFGSSLKSESYLSHGDIPFVRIENIRGGFDINMDHIVYISQADNDRIKNSQLQTDDIILSKVGNSIGFFARVDDTIRTCNISENNIGIKLSAYDAAMRHYILAYLNCSYAQKLVLRRTSGNAQPKLNVGDLCYIPIPQFTNEFHQKISTIILESRSLTLQSTESYQSAESLLAGILGISIQEAPEKSYSARMFSTSLGASGRLDAEYYQPKYDKLFQQLSSFPVRPLGDLVDTYRSIEPGSETYQTEGIPFIRVSDLDKFEIASPEIKLSSEIAQNFEQLYPKKDIILFSKDGSVGIAHKVQKNMEAITSSAILHLKVRDIATILPDYLTLVLNSPVVQLQAERDSNGAVIQHWKPSDIAKVKIPVLSMDIQKRITHKIQKSYQLRQRAKRLLDYAVSAVELAIEIDEKTARAWLEGKNR